MKRISVALAVVLTIGLGGIDAHAAQKAKSKAKSKAKAAAKAVEVSPEMKDFMSQLDVDGKKTTAAIAKFKAKDGETSAMSGDLSVANPKVLKAEKKGDEDRYTMYAETGEARRTFLIIWKDKKIQKIEQLSFDL